MTWRGGLLFEKKREGERERERRLREQFVFGRGGAADLGFQVDGF